MKTFSPRGSRSSESETSVEDTRTRRRSLGRLVTGLLNLASLLALSVLLLGHAQDTGKPVSPSEIEIAAFPSEELAHLEYTLQDGYLHNWLVTVPKDADDPVQARADAQAAPACGQASEIARQPAENVSLVLAGGAWTWKYYKTQQDHLLDLADLPGSDPRCAWAYARVSLSSPQEATIVLTAYGPVDLWLNGRWVRPRSDRRPSAALLDAQTTSFQAALERGPNDLLVRLQRTASPFAMAVRIADLAPSQAPVVRLPTTAEDPARRQVYERLFEQAYLERGTDHRGNHLILHWAEDLETQSPYTVHVQDDQDRIYVEALPVARPSATVNAGHYARLWAGDYQVVLKPPLAEWYNRNLRYQRSIPVHVVDNAYSNEPYGTYPERRREALEDAARREGGLYSEIGKLALGRWDELDAGRVLEAAAQIDRDRDAAQMVGLLGLLARYGDDPRFPPALKERLAESVLGSAYWVGDREAAEVGDPTESQNLLFYTSQVLVGQLYPEHTCAGAGRPCRALGREGERKVRAWLRQQARAEWDVWTTECSCQERAVALSHLVDLVENKELRTLAIAVLDQTLSALARHSYQGVYGAAHARTRTPMLVDGRLEATSGISRLVWGVGVYNHHLAGTVSLAGSTYQAHPDLAAYAAEGPEELWVREQWTIGADGADRAWRSPFAARSQVETVTYKTADYMLSSAQDYRAGERGSGEQIWQATLGPGAVSFVTHPAHMSQSDAYRNNFWRGNAVLPRVAQWKETLVALYELPPDDWMGFTHAYWPVYAFDAYTLREDANGHLWAFARKGEGYLALTAAQGIELIRQGPSAYHELRSYGKENAWLCLVGRAATDGSFEQFQEAVLALETGLHGATVHLDTLRGETLSLGWGEPLRVE